MRGLTDCWLKLYKWIEPFAESTELHAAGCDYVSSIYKFLRPHPDKRDRVFAEVWSCCVSGAGSDRPFLVLQLSLGVVHGAILGCAA